MILTLLPQNIPYSKILDWFHPDRSKYAYRDRAMFALRPHFRLIDICEMTFQSIITETGHIATTYTRHDDGIVVSIDDTCRKELALYFRVLLNVPGNRGIHDYLLKVNPAHAVFFSQQKPKFSKNTLAQHFSALTIAINRHYSNTQPPIVKKPNNLQRTLELA